MVALRTKLQERGWPIGSVPTAMFAYLVFVDVLAGVVLGVVLDRSPVGGAQLRLAVFLAVLAVAFEEGVRRAARLKMRLSADLKRDMTSVWTVATAVALPAGYAAGVIFVLTSYIWFRQHHPTGHPLYRGVFNVALNVLAVIGADLAVHDWKPMWSGLPHAFGVSAAVVVATVVYTVLNRLIPSVALLLNGVSIRELAASREENLIELATLCLGGLVAARGHSTSPGCASSSSPRWSPCSAARSSRELEAAATTDAKTGLLNAVAWEQLAQRELARADRRELRRSAVLIIDIDRFKLVNDRFGHLVGDKVLPDVGRASPPACASTTPSGASAARSSSPCCPNAGEAEALVVAERHPRADQPAARLATASTASPTPRPTTPWRLDRRLVHAHDGGELAELLHAADGALYRAKAIGRNRVVLADRGAGDPSVRVALADHAAATADVAGATARLDRRHGAGLPAPRTRGPCGPIAAGAETCRKDTLWRASTPLARARSSTRAATRPSRSRSRSTTARCRGPPCRAAPRPARSRRSSCATAAIATAARASRRPWPRCWTRSRRRSSASRPASSASSTRR